MIKPCVSQNWDKKQFCVMVSSIWIFLQNPFNNGVIILHNSLWSSCIIERCVCDTSAVKFNSLLNTVQANCCVLGVLPKLTFSETLGSLFKSMCLHCALGWTAIDVFLLQSLAETWDVEAVCYFGQGGALFISCALEKLRIVMACEVFLLTKMFCIMLKTELVTDSNCFFLYF